MLKLKITIQSDQENVERFIGLCIPVTHKHQVDHGHGTSIVKVFENPDFETEGFDQMGWLAWVIEDCVADEEMEFEKFNIDIDEMTDIDKIIASNS